MDTPTHGHDFIKTYRELLNLNGIEKKLGLPKAYLSKSLQKEPKVKLTEEHHRELNRLARSMAEYLNLFYGPSGSSKKRS